MPEIAEVETVRNTLKEKIVGKKIKKVTIRYPKIIETDIEEFQKLLPNQTFLDIQRIGKWLIFELDDYALLSHLRMEGKYFLKKETEPYEKHEHIIFTLNDHTDLRYHDTRKFGRMALMKKDEVKKYKAIQKQGIEPLSASLTREYLYKKLKPRQIPMKTLLLDQTIISGLGNIYADEVLFEAKISPWKKGNEITKKDCDNLILASKKVIAKAIEEGGTTIRSYTSSLGVTGRFQQHLQVHKRENEECYNCHSKIRRDKIGGRSSYYCPKCQK